MRPARSADVPLLWRSSPVKFLLLLLFLPFSSPALAIETGAKGIEILGVIASGSEGQGIALVKIDGSPGTKAIRVGEHLDPDTKLTRVNRDFVDLLIKGKESKVRVGESFVPSRFAAPVAEGGIEKADGNKVKMTAAYRDLVTKTQLSKVLMQAAAVPYYVQGTLTGFRLWDIDADSVYDRVGFKNGDLITAINGNRLSDVGMAIRMLQGMRNEPRAEFTFMRNGEEQTIELVVD